MLKRKPPDSMTNPPAIHQGVTMALLESNGNQDSRSWDLEQ